MKQVITIICALVIAGTAQASLINGDMSSDSLGIVNPIVTNQVNQGWYTYIADAWRMTNGVMQRGDTHTSNDQRGFGQLFTDPGLSGEGYLSFDLVVTNAAAAYPNMNWWLVGYTVTNSQVQFDAVEDIEIHLIDSNRPTNGANYAVTYLTSSFDWTAGPAVAGSVTTNIYTEIDFGTGYDYYAFAFSSVKPAGDYMHVDNVSVAIPEPASVGLFALGVFGLIAFRRRLQA